MFPQKIEKLGLKIAFFCKNWSTTTIIEKNVSLRPKLVKIAEPAIIV
jgi:hypothetical protein